MSGADHLARVHGLPCIVCRQMGLPDTPGEAHHIESIRGMVSDYAVAPLCKEHHRGATGVHGLHRRTFEMRYKLCDVRMLAATFQLLEKAGRLT